ACAGTSSQMVTEYVVRVPKNTTKKYNIMAFNAADKVNFATWHQGWTRGQGRAGNGAGMGWGGPGQHPSAVCPPHRYKGVKKGGVTENASYYIFTQCPDGAFEAFPVQHWYNFTPLAKHRTLTAEEAEEEWERRNKVLNHFSIMQQRRLRDQDEEEEEKEKKAKKKGGELKIHDLEDDLELSSEESEGSEAEGERTPKPKKKAPAGKKKKKKKGSEDEAFEDSDDGDFEGQEVDYMSDASSSSLEEEVGKAKVTKEDDGPKGGQRGGRRVSPHAPPQECFWGETSQKRDRRCHPLPADSSDESQTSEESDIDSETSSALFMAKKKTPPKRERRGSASSSRGNSRPGTPTEPGSTSNTLRAAASKLEQGGGGWGRSWYPGVIPCALGGGQFPTPRGKSWCPGAIPDTPGQLLVPQGNSPRLGRGNSQHPEANPGALGQFPAPWGNSGDPWGRS
uniref:Transcription initiation factor IIF subunit alpha n=1 Tax=Strix occidentalis caurina TaxID=311401 RepID=A0A8D0FJB0_STROC